MPQVLPKEGIARQLDQWLDASTGAVTDWQLVLFVNDIVPDADTVFADLVEPSAAWYARRPLDPAEWQPAELDGNDAVALYGSAAQVYGDVSEEITVYGYAMTDPGDDKIMRVERLDPVVTIPVGRGLTLWPRVRLSTWCPCEVESEE